MDFIGQHPTWDPSEPGSSSQSRLFATSLREWFGLDPKRLLPLYWQRLQRPSPNIGGQGPFFSGHGEVLGQTGLFENNGDEAEWIFPLKMSLRTDMVQVGLNLEGSCGQKQSQLTQLQPRNSHQNWSWDYHAIWGRGWGLPFNVIYFTNNYVPGGILGTDDTKINKT